MPLDCSDGNAGDWQYHQDEYNKDRAINQMKNLGIPPKNMASFVKTLLDNCERLSKMVDAQAGDAVEQTRIKNIFIEMKRD